MANPFDDTTGEFLVLRNDAGQHSLWPQYATVPDGWSVVHGADSREACWAYVEAHWLDLRPVSSSESR